MVPIELEEYLTADGAAPFSEWLDELRDGMARVRIARRLTRLRVGLLGDWKSVGSGVIELREDYGPGYRVYCARRGSALIVLLAGGDKRTQRTCANLLARLDAAQSALRSPLRVRSV